MVAGTDCLPSLAPGARCGIGVQFTPTNTRYRFATLQITDNANGSPHTIDVGGTGYTLSAWDSQGGILTDSPAAAGFNGRVYVFAKGSDNALYVKSSANGVDWSGWTNLGGILTAAPAAAAVGSTLFTLAKGTNNALYERHSVDGVRWTDWWSMGGELKGPPAAAALYGRLYTFAWWRDNTLYERHTLP